MADTGPVVVTQQGTSNSVSFTVDPHPASTSISPASGPANSSVTVTGRVWNSRKARVPSSQWDGSHAVQLERRQHYCSSSIGATTGPVVLGSGGLNSNGVAFNCYEPARTSVGFQSHPEHQERSHNQRTKFGSTQGDSVVRFNGLPASVTTWGANAIAVPVLADRLQGQSQ